METSGDKQWASKYLLDPLTAPDPSEETGPGTHYRSTFGPNSDTASTIRGVGDKRSVTTAVRETAYPSPPQSASPRKTHFPHRQEASTRYGEPPRRSSLERPSTEIPTSSAASTVVPRPRGSSLTERYPGDESHRPLDIIRKQVRTADRHPHLRKQHFVGPDSIDQLDNITGKYHHDGPYDPTLLARNTDFLYSPVEAVAGTTEEALRATPREKVIDSVTRHRPLDGVATVAPGMTDNTGRTFEYEEGTDLMIEGNYKRWPGVQYSPDDLKGKGEPSYSVEKALKDHERHGRHASEGTSGIEMTTRSRSSDPNRIPNNEQSYTSNEQSYTQWEGDMRRSNTTGRKVSKSITRRFGSLRKARSPIE